MIDDSLIDYTKYEATERGYERAIRRSKLGISGFGTQVFSPTEQVRTLTATSGIGDGQKVLIDEFTENVHKSQIEGRSEHFRPRKLTPRECALLMGFDEPMEPLWNIVVSDTQAYRQFGNAVVVPLVREIGKICLQYIHA